MQVKRPGDPERRGGDVGLPLDAPRKKSSCFSNIKIFLVAECALMLAQGTVGAYLVSGAPSGGWVTGVGCCVLGESCGTLRVEVDREPR